MTRPDVPSLDAWAERACLSVRRRPSGSSQPRVSPELAKAADLLATFNRWRRGEDIPVASPEAIGKAIDLAIEILKHASKDR